LLADAAREAVIDEAALTRRAGSAEIMRDQYAKLIEFADRDNITIQVLPFNAELHPATAGTFAIMEFREPYDPNVVYLKSMTSILYVEEDVEMYWYTLAFDHLRAAALGPDESKALISEMAEKSS
jgi:Domain of unknown function (DUF5753)